MNLLARKMLLELMDAYTLYGSWSPELEIDRLAREIPLSAHAIAALVDRPIPEADRAFDHSAEYLEVELEEWWNGFLAFLLEEKGRIVPDAVFRAIANLTHDRPLSARFVIALRNPCTGSNERLRQAMILDYLRQTDWYERAISTVAFPLMFEASGRKLLRQYLSELSPTSEPYESLHSLLAKIPGGVDG